MRDYLGISELGMCARRVVYAHSQEVVPEVSEEQARVMELGHLLEALRRRELKRQGRRVLSPQAEVRFGPFAVGHIDGFVRQDGLPVLWEAKSTTSFSLAKWRKEGLPRRIAWQISAYAKGLSDLLGEQVSKILLETIDRTNGEIFSWTYDRDEAITQDALQRAEFLAQCLTEGTLPDREFDATSSDCRYCPFLSHCRDAQFPADASKDCADANGWERFGELVSLYLAGQDLKEEGEQLVSRARETIQAQLQEHQARKARVNGSLVIWSQVETTKFDGKALQVRLPEIYAQFLKPSSYTRLEVRR
jgi:predicted phage-related endonuclease